MDQNLQGAPRTPAAEETMPHWLFNGWAELGRLALVGTLAYAGLVLLIRLSGERTLAKMNAFDLVVTVALGSTLATILLSRDVALVEGLVAFALLIALQFAITWSSVRSKKVRRLVKAEPTLLLYRGELLRSALRAQRVTEGEVPQALRAQGFTALQDAEAVVLETDGSFTALPRAGDGDHSTLAGVAGAQQLRP
jgi:uncharacterized membrane protein YcaP (DUF421 family)